MKKKRRHFRFKVLSEEGKEQLRGFYNDAVRYFSSEFEIPEQEFPKLKFGRGEQSYYQPQSNVVCIGNDNFLSDIGSTLGEEIAHFVRRKLKGDADRETHSSEFLGFLGRKFLYARSNEEERKKYFSWGEPTYEKTSGIGLSYPEDRREILEEAKQKGFPQLKKRFKDAEKKGDKEEIQLIYKEAREKNYESHIDQLEHARPYDFASDVDLSRVPNLKELYSLSDRAIRMRFFRKDKMYDSDERIKGLEGKVALIFFVSLGIFILTSQINITGNVIGLSNFTFNPLSSIFLVLTLVFGSFLVYKLVTRK